MKATATVQRHTATVVADRFDLMTWRDTYEQSAGLRELTAELSLRHDGATDLLTDAFLAAYQARPRLRDRAEMDPSRLVDHHVLSSLMEPPDFAELRRTTAGDPYAAAMAVLAMAPSLRRILQRAQEAQDQAGQAEQDAVAQQPTESVEEAESDSRQAGRAAEAAAQAMTAAARGLRADAHAAAARAARVARQEAALMRIWGITAGETERMPFAQRLQLAERLRTSRLARWADLIGRFRQMACGERAHKVENAGGELIGITLGDDLSRVVPSELANLGLPVLRAVFAARYAAGELMLYDNRGEQTTGRGAIIACVDTSHSMYEEGPGGVTREAWAKACALALLDQARDAGRDFVGILFSAADKLQVFRFPAGESAGMPRVLEFAETFLGGGTSYQRPLSAAADVLRQEFDDAARARGDIVMITDDDCGVTEEWMRDWKDTKRQLGFRVFGVAVGAPRVAEADSVLDALCDNLRCVEDLTDVHAAADLFRLI
ncbi:VWA domain-containing protein [Streptomyces kunmingensis]|uniref:VWA domain-containing protein n=2 Tax=Streptomyces kunmingensis TaxID=68225 RepID=A0ABU6C9U9_9ACTN|nr:VWA domain-containing protein [Streptomyces kunmingensis]MEB3960620.1 VWA domain-containing protein [Streptomyces kunmingensis]